MIHDGHDGQIRYVLYSAGMLLWRTKFVVLALASNAVTSSTSGNREDELILIVSLYFKNC